MISKQILLGLFIFTQAYCQSQKKDKLSAPVLLSLMKTRTAVVNPNTEDVYGVKLDKGQFASIRVNQINVGLLVLVYDPRDSLYQVVDENGIGQNEIISINADFSGIYTIKILWNRNKPESGRYSITLRQVEKVATNNVGKAKQLFHSWYDSNEPGAAMIVLQDNKAIVKEIRGLANLGANIAITDSSVFEMASCSKQFTAFAVAMLVDRKLIAMDEDIRQYLPEIPDYGQKITIANLVYHTSGIRNNDVNELVGVMWEDNITLPMILKFAAAQKKLKFKPGTEFSYSNTNYNLLAEIVSRVTKQPFSKWTKENIFLPLGMNSTFFKEDPGVIYPNKVFCYKRTENVFTEKPNNFAATGSAGLNTTVNDLIKWVNNFDTKKLISPEMDSLLNSGIAINDFGVKYAFGNYTGSYYGRKAIEHLGLVIGFRTCITRYPEQRFSVIYLSNDNNDATYQRYYKIRDLFLGIPVSKPSIEGLPGVEETLVKFKKNEAIADSVNIKDYEGDYFSEELFSLLKVKVKDRRLIVTHPRIRDIELIQKGKDDFGLIQFNRDENKKIKSFTITTEQVSFTKKI